MGIMDNTTSAFAPFFDKEAIATTKDGQSQTIIVSVFAEGEDETLTDDMMDTRRNAIQLLARTADWWFIKKLERGDRLTLNEINYTISEIRHDFALGMVIKARQA